VTRLGRSSLRTEYRATAADGRTVAEGFETLVWVDPEGKASVPIPEDIRRAIEALEGSRLAAATAGA
jgi:acyl-CoA thioesterase FadM